MNRIINIIGYIVLFGILIKLSIVFVFLFEKLDEIDKLDRGGWFVSGLGVTFAFASVYFVVKIKSKFLKITMVVLDIFTILYYYLYEKLSLPIEYVSIIVAAYSGLIVYFLGSTLSSQIDSDSATVRLRELENRQHIDSERQAIENEIVKTRRRFRQCKPGETKDRHEQNLKELEQKLSQL